MNSHLNDLTHWFPILEATGVPVPETKIIQTDVALSVLLDGETPPGFEAFIAELAAACEAFSYPCFLRTGQTSNKHDWRDSCYIASAEDLPWSVASMVEFSELASFFGLPYRTWAVRKLLPLVAAFTAFRDMPVAREFRCFFRDGEMLCIHPYWPPESIKGPSRPEWRLLLDSMNTLRQRDLDEIRGIVAKVAKGFDGAWSLDIAQTLSGRWVCIDMATMDESFHWAGCSHAPDERRAI